MDYVESLGTSLLAHRLRRLSDAIVDQVAENFTRAGLVVPPRSVSTLNYLRENGPTGPVELGKALKFSHPLMVRALRQLEALGLVEAIADDTDQRRRRVRLTDEGKGEADRSLAMTDAFGREIGRMASDAGLDLASFADTLSGLTKLLAEHQVIAENEMEADR